MRNSSQNFTKEHLNQLTVTEHDTVSVCRPVDESGAVEGAVCKGLESLENNEVDPAETGEQTVAPID